MDQEKPLLVNKGHAAHLLGISERSLDELTRKGIVPSVRLGSRTIRYNLDVIKQVAEQGAASSAAVGD